MIIIQCTFSAEFLVAGKRNGIFPAKDEYEHDMLNAYQNLYNGLCSDASDLLKKALLD